MEQNNKTGNFFNRRKALKVLGITSLSVTPAAAFSERTNVLVHTDKVVYKLYHTVNELKQDISLREGTLVRTLGYYTVGDGGATEYVVRKQKESDGAELSLDNNLSAVLINVSSVNYKMFGAVGDGKNDDGVQIKQAHTYANTKNIPVINLSGEYWIEKTGNIPILNNVQWGSTIFHINEAFNSKLPRFQINSKKTPVTIQLNDTDRKNFLAVLKPGTKRIPELAPYKNSLIIVADNNDRIGFRSGAKFTGQSWAREELFYVAEHGEIIGDIAWEFKNYTSLTAYPADDNYLIIDGGTFYLSGNSPGKTYLKCGFGINRSRTIIRNQYIGLEQGKADVASSPRGGFYAISKVFDFTLENVHLIPFEQDREGTVHDVPAGTYGISAARMLNGLFRNVTAEGGPVHWGVFGTNLNKNFKVQNCRLNRVDVHFHCWNLHIKDSEIGYRGISVTGGGELLLENTSCYSRSFINFRRDFGSKWDGPIRIYNCRFIPATAAETAFLDFNPMDFNYKYPIGFGRSITVENLIIDYNAVTDANKSLWLMHIPDFSRMKQGQRLFFPRDIVFRNVLVEGRTRGVRLLTIPDPQGYDIGRKGHYDGVRFESNVRMVFDNVQLEEPDENERLHISIRNKKGEKYKDEYALYPEIYIRDCKGLNADFGGNIAAISIEHCSVSRLTGSLKNEMPGRLTFASCLFQPVIKDANTIFYSLSASLGTFFTNCTLHAPVVSGVLKPELADHIGFVQVNKKVRFNHLNTILGRDLLNYYKSKHIALKQQFIVMLKCHHELEPEVVL
ncbi:hypothetical protein FW774_17980 [Pedobacter sp. BS3]|uniref:hypothetical protein n=1 Tax=Pedobacter sp. BS3 TaxID=2567937 RepID=UPI0011ED1E37|nr:hypothetical protein [Pedobacter sp. BS3]TZF81451.1 hypothetical protein FW774_17980 [Pedobacter sp. BS3]